MKIAFRGNFRPSHSTESHVSATMELLGHQVVRIQEDEVQWAQVPALCEATDLFWFTSTWHEDFPGGFAALDILHRRGLPTVSHTLDLYIGLDRESQLDIDPFWRTQYVFSADGGHPDVWAAKGINHHWMPPAVFAPECYLAEPDPALVQDVIFVGSYGYHAQWPYRKQLIDWLKETYGPRFTHYDHDSGMRGHRLNQLYASAKVVIGDSCCPGFTQARYWSDRVPETLGRGGFLIHPLICGMRESFEGGTHLDYYAFLDWQELHERIAYFLQHEEKRRLIQSSGHSHVKAQHTYTNRLQEVLAIVAQKEGAR